MLVGDAFEALQLVAFGQRHQGFAPHRSDAQIVPGHVQGTVRAHGHEIPRQQRQLAMLAQLLAHRIARYFGEALVHRVECAEAGNQLDGGLLADTRHAGDVIGAVPHQRQHIANLVRADSPFLPHLVGSHPIVFLTAARRTEQPHAFAHQLQQVLVARHEGNVESVGITPMCEGAHDVVGLESGLFEDRQAQRLRQRFDDRQLRQQVLRHRLAVRLVLWVAIVPLGGSGTVPGQRPVVGLLDVAYAQDDIRHTEHRRSVFAAGIHERAADECVVGAVGDAQRVQHKEARHRHAPPSRRITT